MVTRNHIPKLYLRLGTPNVSLLPGTYLLRCSVTVHIVHSDALSHLESMDDSSVDLIYIDPPFNTGSKQTTTSRPDYYYMDSWPSAKHYARWMRPHLEQSKRILKNTGSIFVHIDHRTVSNIKLLLDSIFGNKNFLNWIAWCYNSGGASKRKFAAKHDHILWYSKSNLYVFTSPREPYPRDYGGRPGFHPEGRIVNDWWQIPIMSTTSNERTGYPNQKPVALLDRIITSTTNPEDTVLDFFAGSGTTGVSAASNNRNVILVDNNIKAIEVMSKRLRPA